MVESLCHSIVAEVLRSAGVSKPDVVVTDLVRLGSESVCKQLERGSDIHMDKMALDKDGNYDHLFLDILDNFLLLAQ